MFVRRLQLTSFRNYRELDLNLEPGHHLFLGDNAQGKSNLLEAVYLLATARSSRAGSDGELIGPQSESALQPFARVQASVERQDGGVQLEALIVGASADLPAGARAGKRLRVNGIPRRAVDLVGQLRAVLFTADDLDIVSGQPSTRRQYLDAAISQVDRGYYAALQRYGRILQQRNASLRRIREGLAGQDELALWDQGLVREGAIVIAARHRACKRLVDLAYQSHWTLSGAAQETLALAYEPRLGDEWRGLLPDDSSPTAFEPLFAAALASQRRREIAAGLSLVGPHRDDLSISLDGAPAATFASRAQVRTAALSLRLAEAHLIAEDAGDPPVLLLDDIVSELDAKRRRSVLEGIAAFDQVWFTATDTSRMPAEFVDRCLVHTVEAGSVSPPTP